MNHRTNDLFTNEDFKTMKEIGHCQHTKRTTELMPPGSTHHGKELCADCGIFLRWLKKPETIEREARNKARCVQLRGLPLTTWEKQFLDSVEAAKKLSPKQQAILDRIFEEKSR